MKVLSISVLLCVALTLREAAGQQQAVAVEQLSIVPVLEEAKETGPLKPLGDAPMETIVELVENKVELALPEEGEAEADALALVQAPGIRLLYCPDGWYQHQSRCFLFVNSYLPWHNAEEHCNTLHANLASVQNPRQYRFLQQLTTMANRHSAWIGGFHLQDRWLWIDRVGFYYENWYTHLDVDRNACIHLRTSVGWSNAHCGTGLPFICVKMSC
ncbi:ladderlectin-like [Oncorhynchus masou masou]|uniref:ladderlectin-like n=1 Tax=Oncorhynchus masou masou TaxID=90313 RepID=UPI0031832AB4